LAAVYANHQIGGLAGAGRVTLVSISLPSNVEFVNNVRNAWTGASGFLPIEI